MWKRPTSQATISKSSRAFLKWRDIIQQVFYCCWSTLYFCSVGGEKKKKYDCRPGWGKEQKNSSTGVWKRRGSACSRLEKCLWPQKLLFKVDQRTYLCLINMCKGSYVKKICDYSWCFPGSNKIILLLARSEAEESKGLFPILLLFLSHWNFSKNFYFLKAFSFQWLFQFEKLFTSKFCHDNTATHTKTWVQHNPSKQ